MRRELASVAALAASLRVVSDRRLQGADRLAAAVVARPLGPVADRAVAAATDLGSVYGMTGMAAALGLTGQRRAAVDVLGGGSVAWSVAQSAKHLVDRPRPYEAHGARRLVGIPAGSSWPSGHTAVAAASAAAVTPLLPPGAAGVAMAGIGFVAASRIYVGVHYLSDVVAGAAIGTLSATVWRAGRRRWGRPELAREDDG